MRHRTSKTGLAPVVTLLAVTVRSMLDDPAIAESGPPTAGELLERAITYHDPHGRWHEARFELQIEETRPDGPSRQTRIVFSHALASFEILTERDGAEIEGLMAEPEWDCVLTLDGSTRFTDEEREKYRLTCERLGWLRDYYTYLWGLPMKLRDPGTRLDQTVVADSYDGQDVWRLRVTYDEEVGGDTWYFYFDRSSFRLAGYRFYHDESKNDGEYITLEGEMEHRGMRVPRRRSWYRHEDDRHLGDDILLELVVQSPE